MAWQDVDKDKVAFLGQAGGGGQWGRHLPKAWLGRGSSQWSCHCPKAPVFPGLMSPSDVGG